MSNLANKLLSIALIAFGVIMLIIGLFFGVGYWKADELAARWLLLATGVGGASYVFVKSYRALKNNQ